VACGQANWYSISSVLMKQLHRFYSVVRASLIKQGEVDSWVGEAKVIQEVDCSKCLGYCITYENKKKKT